MAIYRGTTPIHIINMKRDCSGLEVLYITYKQGDRVVLEKTIEDVTFDGNFIRAPLTQEETLAFLPDKVVKGQLRGRYPDGTAIETKTFRLSVEDCLKDGVI